MKPLPLRFRQLPSGLLLFVDDAGGFFTSTPEFLERYALGTLKDSDCSFLLEDGHAYEKQDDAAYTAFAFRWAGRRSTRRTLDYAILVPTLRCDLTCGYCQVSRAPAHARQFDWSDDVCGRVLDHLDRHAADQIKIEFQGGEPMLRLDLLERVRTFCRQRFSLSQFVVCTNLQSVSPEAWDFLEADDTFVSTSLDGDIATHRRQRTKSAEATSMFFSNLDEALRRLGVGKVSALPTIDIDNPPDPASLIEAFEARGLTSISLRPTNHQGFARRKPAAPGSSRRWNAYHSDFVETLIRRNFASGRRTEEYYLSHCLRRVLRLGADRDVDLRNPSAFGMDYVVIDHDGLIYPTDEARMLARIGMIDLSIGSVVEGLDAEKVATLNAAALNDFEPDCVHCAFQPFCGSDPIDNISRCGRIDAPKADEWFCRRQTSVFDKVFELLYRSDEATRFSLAAWLDVPDWPAYGAAVHA